MISKRQKRRQRGRSRSIPIPEGCRRDAWLAMLRVTEKNKELYQRLANGSQ